MVYVRITAGSTGTPSGTANASGKITSEFRYEAENETALADEVSRRARRAASLPTSGASRANSTPGRSVG